MSEHNLFLQERDRIDFLVEQGYKITNIIENLNGSFVEFEKGLDDEQKETLHIVTPKGRKYFAVTLIKQQKAEASS